MSEKFSDLLNSMAADADRIQQALRIYLSERTDDMTPEEMTEELRGSATDAKQLSDALRDLEQSPQAVEQAALLYFECEWEDEARRPAVRAVFENAKNQLPVVETVIIAVAAMYAIHMLVTKGVVEHEKITRRNRDGTFETIVVKKLEAFHPVLAASSRLFGAAMKASGANANGSEFPGGSSS
jgi:hypothetical protein